MSLLAHEERDLENVMADFDLFLSQRNWSDAHAAIDSIREKFGDHSANIMMKSLYRAQSEDFIRLDKEQEERYEYGTLSDESVDEDGN